MRRKPTRPSAFRQVCQCCGQKATADLCLGCTVESNADCPNCRATLAAKRDLRTLLAPERFYTPASLRDALKDALITARGDE